MVLDTLDLLVEISTELGATEGSTSQVLSCALRILLHILSKRQGVEVLQHAFALQRAIVAKVSADSICLFTVRQLKDFWGEQRLY